MIASSQVKAVVDYNTGQQKLDIFQYSNGELNAVLILKARLHTEHSLVSPMQIREDCLYYRLYLEIIPYSLYWALHTICEDLVIF